MMGKLKRERASTAMLDARSLSEIRRLAVRGSVLQAVSFWTAIRRSRARNEMLIRQQFLLLQTDSAAGVVSHQPQNRDNDKVTLSTYEGAHPNS